MSATTIPEKKSFRPAAAATEVISVVGITPGGEVPLVASPEAIRLPECSTGPAALRDMQERLREETGYEAAEFVLMRVLRPAAGKWPGPTTLLLAPGLSRNGPGPRGLEFVPLNDLRSWLGAQRAAGTVVDPRVPLGVRMAERYFARWALARLQEALRHRRAARPPVAAAG